MKIILFILLLFCASCSLFTGFSKREFRYATAAQHNDALTLLVPKGFRKESVQTDSAGNKEQVYYYSNGTVLYFAYLEDTTKKLQPIDTSLNIPLPHKYGGWIYKGMDSTGLYWREIKQDRFRFGYRFVPASWEIRFDSVVNFASLLKGRKGA